MFWESQPLPWASASASMGMGSADAQPGGGEVLGLKGLLALKGHPHMYNQALSLHWCISEPYIHRQQKVLGVDWGRPRLTHGTPLGGGDPHVSWGSGESSHLPAWCHTQCG